MDRRVATRGRAEKRSRRLKMLLWTIGLSVITIGLIYFEQTAILYVLATLGMTALLVVVALADLKGKVADTSELGDDAAAIGSGMRESLASATASTGGRRVATKRK